MENKKCSILYVDDEPQNLMTFKAAFRRDFEVLTATNANDAYTILSNHDIEVIIADQRMPIITGVEFLTKVKTQFPNPIRMILTGYSDIEALLNRLMKEECIVFYQNPGIKRN
jgi:response regulator RpfG family c-di-GMP phosphodiesterase